MGIPKGYNLGYNLGYSGRDTMNTFTSIGQWIRQQRKLLNLTQAQLAEQVGCAVVTIKKIEQETRRPSPEMAELLATHLGVPQMERTQFSRLARGEAAATETLADPMPLPAFLSSTPDTDGLFSKASTSFVAREQERQWLHERLAHAIANRQPQVLFVAGEAGRGKSALLTAFAREATARHDRLLVADGLCSAHIGQGDPFLPFRDLLDLFTGDLEPRWYGGNLTREQATRLWYALPHTLAALVEQSNALFHTLIPVIPLYARLSTQGLLTHFAGEAWATQLIQLAQAAHPSTPRDNIQQQQLFEQVTRLLRTMAERQPLLLLLDDLQWIDESSLALLFHLSRRLHGSPVLMVGAYRGNEVDGAHTLSSTLHELTRRFGEITLDLDALDQQSHGQPFLDALLDQQPNQLDADFRQQLLAQTGGHPLFTLELLRHLQDQQLVIADPEEGWVQRQPLEIATMPARIEAVLSQRTGQLDPTLQELLTVAAVEGERFTAQLVGTILERTERETLQQLDQMQKQQGLVREQGHVQVNGHHLNRYHFHHALFQQFFYQRLGSGERRLLHRRVAVALEALYGQASAEYAATLAYHFGAGGDTVHAATYRVLAGDRARQQSALIEAVAHYRGALEQWPESDQVGRAGLMSKLGDLLWTTGQTNAAMTIFQEALALFTELEDEICAGDTLRRMGRIYWELGQLDASWRHYWAAIERLENSSESVELAEAISAIAQMYMMTSQTDEAIAWGQRALALAERLGAEHVVIHALNNLGGSLIWREVDEGLDLLRRSLRRAEAANLHYDVCRAHYNLSDLLIVLGRYGEAYEQAQALVAYATEVHVVQMVMAGHIKAIEADWYHGKWRRALASYADLNAWRAAERFNPIGDSMVTVTLGRINNDCNCPHAAYALLTDAAAKLRAADEAQLILPFLGQLLRATIQLGKERETVACIEEACALIAARTTNFDSVGETLLTAYHWLLEQLPTEWNEGAEEQAALRKLAITVWDQLMTFIAQSPTLTTPAIDAQVHGIRALHEYNLSAALAQFQLAAECWQQIGRVYDELRVLQTMVAIMQQQETPAQGSLERRISAIRQQLADELVGSEFADSWTVDGETVEQ